MNEGRAEEGRRRRMRTECAKKIIRTPSEDVEKQ
jgi:hypothetical protein